MSDSSSDEESGPKSMVVKKKKGATSKSRAPEDELDVIDPKRPRLGAAKASAANQKISTMEWFYENMTNGEIQVVPCPYVSNDLTTLKVTQPVKMTDDKGTLLVRSIHEKDNEEEPDDIVIGKWSSAVTGTEIEIKQFQWNKLGLDFTIVLYGKRRTGKTHFIKALCNQFRRYFPTVVVFTKTKFNGDLLKIFPDSYIFNDMDEATLERILEAQKAFVGEIKAGPQPWVNGRMLLVFDDVLSDKKNPRYNEMLRKMFFEGRHFWISMIITSQDSKGLPPGLKQNTDMSVILPMSARRDRETLADNTLPFLWNDKDCREFLAKTMEIKHNFLAVVNCRGAKPISEQVYLGIITPLSHIPRYVMGSYPCWKNDLDQLRNLGYDYLKNDTRLEAWNIETHIPPTVDDDDRPDGMMEIPQDEESYGTKGKGVRKHEPTYGPRKATDPAKQPEIPLEPSIKPKTSFI